MINDWWWTGKLQPIIFCPRSGSSEDGIRKEELWSSLQVTSQRHMGSGETGEGKRLESERNPGILHTIINLLSERHKRRDGQQSGLPSNVAVPDSVSSPAASFLFTFLKTTPDFHQIKMIKSSQLFLRPNLNLVIYYRGWVWVVCFKEPQTTVFAPVDEAEKHKTPKICINYPK